MSGAAEQQHAAETHAAGRRPTAWEDAAGRRPTAMTSAAGRQGRPPAKNTGTCYISHFLLTIEQLASPLHISCLGRSAHVDSGVQATAAERIGSGCADSGGGI